MSKFTFKLERLLVYLWGFVLPWQTAWIYRSVIHDGVKFEYDTLLLYASELVLWILFSVSFFNFRRSVVSYSVDWRKSKKYLLFLVLFFAFPLYTFLSAWWSIDSAVSLRHALYIIEGYMFLAAVVISRVSTRDWIRSFLVGSIAPIVLGLFQWFSQTTFSSTLFGLSEHISALPGASIVASETIGRWLRAYGSFPHPNIFAGYLVFILALTFLFSLEKLDFKNRVFVCVVHILAVFALGASFSRSGWIGYIFVLIGFIIFWLKERPRDVAFLFFLSIVISVFFGVIYQRIVYTRSAAISVSELRSITERTEGVERAWHLQHLKPLIGFGGGTFTQAVRMENPRLPGYVYQPVHLTPLVVLVEYGWIGILFFSFSCGILIYFGIKQSNVYRTLYWVAGVLPLVIISFLDHYFVTLYPGVLIFFAYCSLFFRFSTSSPQHVHIL